MTLEDAKRCGLNDDQARKLAFMTAPNLDAALGIVWCNDEDSVDSKEYYYHYTSVPYLLSNILKRSWYMEWSVSPNLNDQQEVKKFGDIAVARRTFQLSFGKGTRESSAFWGLYGKNSPFAIKVLIPAQAIRDWISELKASGSYNYVGFKDVVYASIPSRHKQAMAKNRGCHLFWNGVTCTFGEDKKVKDELPERLRNEKYTGWFKDVEWMHENETRLCVRCLETKEKSINIPIPPALIEKMSFTFSPWADESTVAQIKDILVSCLKMNQKMLPAAAKRREMSRRFHISTVSGALRFAKEKSKKCNDKRCIFGVLLEGKEK